MQPRPGKLLGKVVNSILEPRLVKAAEKVAIGAGADQWNSELTCPLNKLNNTLLMEKGFTPRKRYGGDAMACGGLKIPMDVLVC